MVIAKVDNGGGNIENFCSCNCHDGSYQLVRNSIASNKIESLSNSDTNQNMDY